MTAITEVAVIFIAFSAKMFFIHDILVVIMTIETVDHCSGSRIGVTGGTIGPFVIVSSGEDREELWIMIRKQSLFASWMTIKTGRT